MLVGWQINSQGKYLDVSKNQVKSFNWVTKVQTCHSLQSGRWDILKRVKLLKSCQNYKTGHDERVYFVKTKRIHCSTVSMVTLLLRSPKHCVKSWLCRITLRHQHFYQLFCVTQAKPWQCLIFDANEAAVRGHFTTSAANLLHRLYSHDQKRGRAKETSALSTSMTEIPLKTGSRWEFTSLSFNSHVCLLAAVVMMSPRHAWWNITGSQDSYDKPGCVRLYSVSLAGVSHPRSDPCCVFLPELVVCTDIRSDSSTADTEQNLCVPHGRNSDQFNSGKSVNHEYMSNTLTLLW